MTGHLFLSPREQQVLRCLIDGMSNKDIASELKISTETVKVHVRSIMNKKGMDSRLEVATAAQVHPEWFKKFCSKCGKPL